MGKRKKTCKRQPPMGAIKRKLALLNQDMNVKITIGVETRCLKRLYKDVLEIEQRTTMIIHY